jgi:hypothetical protein
MISVIQPFLAHYQAISSKIGFPILHKACKIKGATRFRSPFLMENQFKNQLLNMAVLEPCFKLFQLYAQGISRKVCGGFERACLFNGK